MLVKKKEGSYQFCVDNHKLNNVKVKDSYSLPRIDNTLDSLARARCFSTLDLASGYGQVGLKDEVNQKTAFTPSQGCITLRCFPLTYVSSLDI